MKNSIWVYSICVFTIALPRVYADDFSVFVLNGSGWSTAEVAGAIAEVEEIYNEQCQITLTSGEVFWIKGPENLQQIDEIEQITLIQNTGVLQTTVFFINGSVDPYQAYSYLPSAPTPNKNTIWLTRNIHPSCIAKTLAHELGHVFLDDASHHEQISNLMHHRCVATNIKNSPKGRHLTSGQCATISIPSQ